MKKNHLRMPKFFSKIEKILSFLDEIIMHHFRNIDIFQIFDDNNRVLLYFLNKKIITINESIYEWKKNKNWNKFSIFIEYFYPETKNYLTEFEKHIFENAYCWCYFENEWSSINTSNMALCNPWTKC